MTPQPHGSGIRILHLAIDTIAAQIQNPTRSLKHPLLHAHVHAARPILGMRAENENVVGIQIEILEIELKLRIQVILEVLTLQPGEEPPLAGRKTGL